MSVRLIVLLSLLNELNGDCIYPEWKMLCQKSCMEKHFYEIQLNQCYSSDPNQLTCKCNGHILTNELRNLIESNNSRTLTSTTVDFKLNEEMSFECVPLGRCLNERMICNGLNEYCKCVNGSWMNRQCPNGKRCEKDSSMICIEKEMSSSSISSLLINEKFILFVLLIAQNQ